MQLWVSAAGCFLGVSRVIGTLRLVGGRGVGGLHNTSNEDLIWPV